MASRFVLRSSVSDPLGFPEYIVMSSVAAHFFARRITESAWRCALTLEWRHGSRAQLKSGLRPGRQLVLQSRWAMGGVGQPPKRKHQVEPTNRKQTGG